MYDPKGNPLVMSIEPQNMFAALLDVGLLAAFCIHKERDRNCCFPSTCHGPGFMLVSVVT